MMREAFHPFRSEQARAGHDLTIVHPWLVTRKVIEFLARHRGAPD